MYIYIILYILILYYITLRYTILHYIIILYILFIVGKIINAGFPASHVSLPEGMWNYSYEQCVMFHPGCLMPAINSDRSKSLINLDLKPEIVEFQAVTMKRYGFLYLKMWYLPPNLWQSKKLEHEWNWCYAMKFRGIRFQDTPIVWKEQ